MRPDSDSVGKKWRAGTTLVPYVAEARPALFFKRKRKARQNHERVGQSRSRTCGNVRLLRIRVDELPGHIRIVLGDCRGERVRVGAEVLLVNTALLVNDKSHYAGIAPFIGIGNQGMAGDHVAVDDVIVFTAGGMRPLAREDFEEVSVVRTTASRGITGTGIVLGRRVLGAVAFRASFGDERAKRAWSFIGSSFPVQAVVLARRADEPGCIGRDAIVTPIIVREIFPLRDDISAAGGDCG